MLRIVIRLLALWLSWTLPGLAFGQTAPDPTGTGPNDTTSAEYKFDPAIDPDILGDRNTELWARVYRPTTLAGPTPVVLFLHGNHGTCGTGMNPRPQRSEEHTSELQSLTNLVCRLLLDKKTILSQPGCADSKITGDLRVSSA